MSIVIGILEEGLIYAIMALGLYITYKILDFPDLSVDGTFPMGAAVTAALILKGVHPALTLVLAFFAGAAAGCVTGLIHVKLKVRDLLSGIIVMTALYSVNLRIAGKANVPLFSRETIFDNGFLTEQMPEALAPYSAILILLAIVVLCKLCLDLFLKTRAGYLLRAAGDNEVLVTSLAKDKGAVKILGLALANGFVALAGAIYGQKTGYFEISSGTGVMVMGLASVIIGTKLFQQISFVKATTAVIFGTILYKACIAAAISMGMAPSDLKLITAALFLIILVVTGRKERKVKIHA